MLTLSEVSNALPAHLKSSATQGLVDALNTISLDPEAAEAVRDNFLSYTRVLQEGRFKIDDYLNAVAYVSFKLMGYSNRESYERTFPGRYQTLVARGTSDKDISAYVAAFSKGKLVTMVMEQSIVPSWVLNQDAYQKAINTQMDLMTNAKSEKVRSDAANSILTHLKKPESKQIELNVNTTNNSGLDELKDKMLGLAKIQQELIAGGAFNTHQIAQQNIIDVTPKDVSE